jgi:hypothetical protein
VSAKRDQSGDGRKRTFQKLLAKASGVEKTDPRSRISDVKEF